MGSDRGGQDGMMSIGECGGCKMKVGDMMKMREIRSAQTRSRRGRAPEIIRRVEGGDRD